MPRLNRVIETALYVDDLDRADRFYAGLFELDAMFRSDTLVAYNVAGASVLLLFRRGAALHTQAAPGGSIPPHDGAGPLHICFAIDAEELAAWEARLDERAVAIEGRMNWDRGGQSLYFRDPDGHLLELMTPGTWPSY